VNAIAPGFIDVGMSKGMPDEMTENFKNKSHSVVWVT
jgi:hypothetical protein